MYLLLQMEFGNKILSGKGSACFAYKTERKSSLSREYIPATAYIEDHAYARCREHT